MKSYTSSFVTVAALAAALGGCSSDGGTFGSSLTTSSVEAAKPAAVRLDPACVALTAKIDTLRKDGVTERVEKASTGKTTTVSVKRESLAKMTELDRANADYQTKCSAPGLARPMTVAPAAAAAVPAPAAKVSTAAPAKAKVAAAAAAPVAAAGAPVAAAAVTAAPVAAAVAPAVAAPVAPTAAPVVTAPVAPVAPPAATP